MAVKIVELKNVTKEYGSRLILDNINLSIEEGDIFGIIGASGSGKSTLLSMIVGFLEPDEGQVLYYSPTTGKAYDLIQNLRFLRKQIGFTPQHLSFYPKLTVKENLLHFGRMYHIPEKVLIDNAKSLLKFTGLWKFRDLLGEEMSGGMQKRLDIGCSLVHKPKVLILDEPTVDLDPLLRRDLMRLIKEVNKQGMTIIIASHDHENIELLCNKVAVIHKKHVYAYGSVDELKQKYGQKFGTVRVHTGPTHEKVMGLLGKSRVPMHGAIDHGTHLTLNTQNLQGTLQALLRMTSEHHLPFTHVELSSPTLRSVFEQITKE
ncbi:ABC transporter ATP-binding protein [archaeon]|jgi:ABC-2 type transport system ATP-binding protein|nr:ABC transporter ATP-binding protein [archaeon]MBT6697714.1 ABC transporter ATP-binding protein [archaeon]